MSPTGFLIVAFFVLVSGVLSYYGDVVGRKLGKKKLTLGRLRPRHTAALMTALFGMIGSMFAIVALLVVSEPVRVMLFQGDKLQAQNDSLRRDNQKATDDLAKNQKELADTKGEVKTEQERVKAEQEKVTSAQAEVGRIKGQVTLLNEQAKIIRNQVVSIRSQLTALKAEYQKVQIEKAKVEKDKQYAQSELLRFQDENLKLTDRNLKLTKEIQTQEDKVKKLQGDFDKLSDDYVQLQEKYKSEAERTRSQIDGLQKQVEEASKSLDEANRLLKLAQDEADFYSKTANVSRTQPMMYSARDELARIPIRSNLNAAEARTLVLALLEQSNALAKSGGAGSATNPNNAAVLALPPDKNGQRPTETQLTESIIRQISNVDHEQVLISNAYVNSFKFEPVAIIVRALPNPVVYKKGDVIAETRIDGTLTQDQVVQAISKFAQETLAPKAMKDGLIPAIGHDNPLGEITQEDLFKLVAEIKSHQFPSRVKFVAAQDIRAGDKLKLEFRVS